MHAAWMFLAAAFAQGPAKVEFEAASIKPALPVPGQMAASPYRMTVEGPRVDIVAKIPDGVPKTQVPEITNMSPRG